MGNEAGDFFLMALRAPSPSPTDTGPQPSRPLPTTTATAERGDVVNPAAAFSWDVLARKRIVLGAGAAGATSGTTGVSRSAARPEYPSPGSCSSRYKEAFYSSRGGRDGDGSDGGPLPLSTARHQDDRGRRRIKPTPAALAAAGGGRGGGNSGHAGRYHSSSTSRPRDGSGDSLSPSPTRTLAGTDALAAVGGGAGAAPLPTMTTTAMDVTCLRFSPGGDVLAAACGSAIHLYRQAGGGAAGGTPAADRDIPVVDGGEGGRPGVGMGGGGRGGSGAYRRYGVCTGHGTIVKCFDFSRDGSVVQSNDASGELLFWEVATGRQV